MTAAERPRSIEMTLAGDFGGGAWTFEPHEGGTRALLDWRPEVEEPLVRSLTPLLRPLFRANRTRTMRRGQEAIVRLLESRRQAAAS